MVGYFIVFIVHTRAHQAEDNDETGGTGGGLLLTITLGGWVVDADGCVSPGLYCVPIFPILKIFPIYDL